MEMNEYIFTIVAKKLQHQATESELAELEQWIEADETNRQTYREMLLIWQQTEPDSILALQLDTNNAWLKLKKAIFKGLEPETIVVKIETKRFLSLGKALVLAVITTLAIVGILLWKSNFPSSQSFSADNQNLSLTLPDGSLVLLRKGSTVHFPSVSNAKQRGINLEGEAYFNIKRDEKRPFTVITSNAEVKVLGTTFLVHTTSIADEIMVLSGSVCVTDKRKPENRVVLEKGKKALFQDNTFKHGIISDSNFMAWKSGILTFSNDSLGKVLEDLKNYYGIDIVIEEDKDKKIAGIPVSVRFENQSVYAALDEICLATGLYIKKEADKMVIYRK